MVIFAKWQDRISMGALEVKGSGTSNIWCKGISVGVGTAITVVWCKAYTRRLVLLPNSIFFRRNIEKTPTAVSARTRFCMSTVGSQVVKVSKASEGD